jgi:two-component system response regulator NreC
LRILIADDNEFVRRGVMNILARVPEWEVCGEAKDGNEALQKAQELLPDLALLDVSMPGLYGLDVARLLLQSSPDTKILIMSQNDPAILLSSALKAGAHGCIDKSHLSRDLLPAIESVSQAVGSHSTRQR